MLRSNVRIEWSDLDGLGHVGNLEFYRYIQVSRIDVLRHANMCRLRDTDRYGSMVVHLECDFKKQLFFPGSIAIDAQVTHIGNTSYSTTYTLTDDEGDVAAVAKDVIVFYDFLEGGKTEITPDRRARLRELME